MPSRSSRPEGPGAGSRRGLLIDAAVGPARVGFAVGRELVAWREGETRRGGARELAGLVEAVLAEAGAAPGFSVVCSRGPGSFTGVRVGIAFARGFARGRGVALSGYHGLEALVRGAGTAGCEAVLAGVDALRGEGFLGAWRVTEGGVEVLEAPGLVPWTEVDRRFAGVTTRLAAGRLPGDAEGFRVVGAEAALRGAAGCDWGEGCPPIFTRGSWAEEAGAATGPAC